MISHKNVQRQSDKMSGMQGKQHSTSYSNVYTRTSSLGTVKRKQHIVYVQYCGLIICSCMHAQFPATYPRVPGPGLRVSSRGRCISHTEVAGSEIIFDLVFPFLKVLPSNTDR